MMNGAIGSIGESAREELLARLVEDVKQRLRRMDDTSGLALAVLLVESTWHQIRLAQTFPATHGPGTSSYRQLAAALRDARRQLHGDPIASTDMVRRCRVATADMLNVCHAALFGTEAEVDRAHAAVAVQLVHLDVLLERLPTAGAVPA